MNEHEDVIRNITRCVRLRAPRVPKSFTRSIASAHARALSASTRARTRARGSDAREDERLDAVAMVLSLRPRQRHAVVELINLMKNSKTTPAAFANDPDAEADEANTYKVLVLDKFTHDIIAPLVTLKDLRDHGVTLHLKLQQDREEIPDTPAVYFVAPTAENVKLIANDFKRSLYDSYHLNFSSALPTSALEELATSAVRSGVDARVKCVRDQYLGYISLEDNLFDLSIEDGYRLLHDPRAAEKDVERMISSVVTGLFSACATLGQVPVIRSQRGGAAEMVAKELESRIRDALNQRGNPFEGGARMTPGSSSVQRPLLCLFDRNFDLTAMLQHAWTYQPLVHDVLNMRLNRVDVDTDGSASAATAGSKPKSYTLERADPFWAENSHAQFPKVAEEVEAELAKYKEAIKRVNAQAAMVEDEGDALGDSTAKLADAVQSLPELQEKKRVIDKHTNIATALLGNIKQRGLDEYYAVEEDLLAGKGDKPSVMSLLQATGRGSAEDKVRLAILYTLSATEGMSPQDAEEVEGALRASGANISALSYIKRMMTLNASLAKNASADGGGHRRTDSSQGNILEWADKLYGQSLNTITKGVKNLLSGERVLPIAVAVETLMANQPGPESSEYAYLDPKSPHGKAHAPREGDPAFHDGICFVIGGGNYLEYQSLEELKARERTHVRSITYGSTSLCASESFLAALASLGGIS